MEALQVIRMELDPNEQLIWSGTPRQGPVLHASDAAAIPFGLVWTSIIAVIGYRSYARGDSLHELLWFAPFLLVAIHLLFGRFFVESLQRSKTYYGVTTKRVVIVSGLFNRQVTSLDLGDLDNITLSERSNQSGTIVFGPGKPTYGGLVFGSRTSGAPLTSPSFDMIQGARKVYNQIRDAKARTPK